MRLGMECLLSLKHTTILTTSKSQNPDAKGTDLANSQAEKNVNRKKNKGGNKQRLEKLLSYHKHHKRLVVEKGLPPSRRMLQHATSPSSSHLVQRPEPDENKFNCDHCAAFFNTKRGLNMHIRMMHKATQKSETLREEDTDDSLNISEAYDVRRIITDSSIIGDEDSLSSTEETATAEDESDTPPV